MSYGEKERTEEKCCGLLVCRTIMRKLSRHGDQDEIRTGYTSVTKLGTCLVLIYKENEYDDCSRETFYVF